MAVCYVRYVESHSTSCHLSDQTKIMKRLSSIGLSGCPMKISKSVKVASVPSALNYFLKSRSNCAWPIVLPDLFFNQSFGTHGFGAVVVVVVVEVVEVPVVVDSLPNNV